MKFKKIVLLDFEKGTLGKEYLDRLAKITNAVEIVGPDDKQRLEKIKDADALLVRIFTKVDKEIINHCKYLKYVSAYSTAFNEIDAEYAAQKGIVVTNVPGYSTEAVAEFFFAELLAHIRELEKAKKQAKKGDYSFDKFLVWELKDKTLGIIGLGAIGKRVAEIGLGFGMKVIYWSRNRKKDYERRGIKYVSVSKLLKTSDIIGLHLALNEETKGFLNKQRLAKIKPGAILASPSPLKLIDLNALIKLLEAGRLHFIADSFDEVDEKIRSKFKPLKNCTMYPPVAFRTREALKTKDEIYIDNIVSFSKGKIKNRVN